MMKQKKEFVVHDPNLPELSPMYTCLWTLIVPSLTNRYIPKRKRVKVLTSRTAILYYYEEGRWQQSLAILERC